MLGASAGGHLALLQGFKDSVPVKVKAIVDFYGPADMAAMYNSPAIPGGELAIYNVMGATPTSDSLLYAHSSPINFINTASAPTIILHGGSDIIVSHAQSDSLYAKLAAAGVTASFITYPTQGHGWTNADTLTNSLNHVQNFLIQHMP